MDNPDNIIIVHFKDKQINLHFDEFDENVNIDDLTRIDYSNLFAELITVPALMNRVGIWKAEADNAMEESRLARNIKAAELGEHYRKVLVTKDTYANGKEKTKYPTKDEVDNAITLNPDWQKLQRIRLRKGKEAGYLDSLYWAIKSKEKKLDKIGEKMNLTPEEFERNLVEGKWNGIMIKVRENLIK